jgi:hypothetical protein
MKFEFTFTDHAIELRAKDEATGLLGKLLGKKTPLDPLDGPNLDRSLAFAIGDLRAFADEVGEPLVIESDVIRLSHRLAARLDSQTADVLGFPPIVDLVLKTDVEGQIGKPSFRIVHQWWKHGVRQFPARTGAVLTTTKGARRIPLFVLEALEVADAFKEGSTNEALHWEALARFRQALDPGVKVDAASFAGRVSMTNFLEGLEVHLTDCFSISPRETPDGLDFDPVPFSGKGLELARVERGNDDASAEDDAELGGEVLREFQHRLRSQGPLPAYRVGQRNYLVVDPGAAPVLKLMAEMQQAPPAERADFVRNPRPLITHRIERHLRDSGKLDGLSPVGEEEAIEAIAGPLFVETGEYSERVTGKVVYERPDVGIATGTDTTWLPEFIDPKIRQAVQGWSRDKLAALHVSLQEARSAGQDSIEVGGETTSVSDELIQSIGERLVALDTAQEMDRPEGPVDLEGTKLPVGPVVIATKDHFTDLSWLPKRGKREPKISEGVPSGILTTLKEHQKKSLEWQVSAWKSGLPGILNADEQGLGKTLQTIAFLRWLKLHMAVDDSLPKGPVLIVAPTSLLENWEHEVERHLEERGLGHLIKLYGSAIGGFRRRGGSGVDIKFGEEQLDFDQLHEAIAEKRGHRYWMLTTYTTLTNYQHSLARLSFSTVVFDEIQALKNPVSLRAVAARAINADFRIGLTGTPIENSATDLWAIMDQLCPGALDTLTEFRQRYGTPDEENMRELHERIFHPQNGLPPVAIRRLKAFAAADLPKKSRRLMPRPMPPIQAATYDLARQKLAEGRRGSALKMLHHIRSVSVHPAMDDYDPDSDFVGASGRLEAVFDILRRVRDSNERALVFIESRRMQERFIQIACHEFQMRQIDLINGDTPIQKRQAIVDRFQRHLEDDRGFDLLVLGPKAAGTGLTLTAATHVIHLSRWWNPAVEEQCNDRVHRLGQIRPVTVHLPMAIHPGYREHSFDCLLHSLMTRKRRLASSALWPMGDTDHDSKGLEEAVAAAPTESTGDTLDSALRAMFDRDGIAMPPIEKDGSILID